MILQQEQLEGNIYRWNGVLNGKPWTLFCGDAVESLRQIADGSVNCIVTSPPYYCLRDYGVDGQIGLEETVEDYIESLCAVMDESYRVLREDGLLFLNLGDTYYSGRGQSRGKDTKSNKRRFGLRAVDKSGGMGMNLNKKSAIGVPWRVAIEMMTRNWTLRSPIIWHRDKALPEAVQDRPRRSYEYIFMFSKDRFYYFNRQPLVDKKYDEDVWTILARPKAGSGINTAPYPDQLVLRCLEIGCQPGGVVLDPFLGSGTTMRVALQNGFSAIGIDISRDFCEYALNDLEGM